MRRALISVYDKTGLEAFARGLAELGFDLVASGGTADFLEREVGVDVERVEDLTGVAEMLGGRVKTLHPRIHAAILARRDDAEDVATLDEHSIQPFDIVCVNLYPFSEVAGRYGVREEEAVEMIDVGGPSMLRGAAKNFAHCAPVCQPGRYPAILAELREAGLDARPVDEVGIEVRVGDNAEEVGDEVFAHVEKVTMRIGANFVPIKHEGVIYVRPPLS